MAWRGDRARRLPRDWDRRREFVRARAGGRCEAVLRDGSRCEAAGTECDHVVHGDDHACTNLQWLCSWHHRRKTQAEAAADLAALRARLAPPPRPHPGLVTGAGGGTPPPGRSQHRKMLSVFPCTGLGFA